MSEITIRPTIDTRRTPPRGPQLRSAYVENQLAAQGVAQVFVILKEPPPVPSARASLTVGTNTSIAELQTHFVADERTRTAALLRASRPRGSAAPGARLSIKANEPPATYYPYLGILLGYVTRDGLEALETNASVESVTGAPPFRLIRPRRLRAAASSTRASWGLAGIGAPKLWKKGFDGTGVTVGHLDTGADGTHPALKPAIAAFAEFNNLGRKTNREDAFESDTIDQHGTHTAGTIAGRPFRKTNIGVAPGASLVSAMVIEGGNVVARVIGGLNWAVGRGARIISMSLGLPEWHPDFLPIVDVLRFRGVLPVFAVGNEGPATSRSPGNYAKALSVGAVDRKGDIPDWSSSDRFSRQNDPVVPDLIAPGVDILSSKPGRAFQLMDGTSMATPHVAGLAALLMQAVPQASADHVEAAIFASCTAPAGMLPERGNRGIPDATRALDFLQQHGA